MRTTIGVEEKTRDTFNEMRREMAAREKKDVGTDELLNILMITYRSIRMRVAKAS